MEYPLTIITITSTLILLLVLRSFNDTLYHLDLANFSGPSVSLSGQKNGGARGDGAGSCRMAWMNPLFSPIPIIRSSLRGKYQTYLYREQGLDIDHQPNGSPVLFIPGNAGSFRQARSVAAATARLYYKEKQRNPYDFSPQRHPGLDFFSLDFNEDLSAFHGGTILEQAEYANDVISHILEIYAQSRLTQRSSLPVPTSVLIIAHSMGGIVARKMIRMPNYVNGTINTILSLSTPHTIPPITLDRGIETIYDEINGFWRDSYFGKSISSDLNDVILVSISGSTSDTTVSPDSSSLLTLAPVPHGLTVYTTGMPEVWSPVDHRAILWCDQLRHVIARSLLAITHPHSPSQVKSLEERASILRSYFQNGRGLRPRSDGLEQRLISSSDQATHLVHSPLSRLKLSQKDLQRREPFIHVIPLKQNSESESAFDTFTLLTNLPLGIRTYLLACNGTFESDRLKLCKSLTMDYSTTLPSSHFNLREAPVPGPDDEADPHDIFHFIEIPKHELSAFDFISIITSNPPLESGSSSDPEFLISEFNSKSSVETYDTSLLELIFWGLNVPRFPALANPRLVSEIYLPALDSSLLAFKIQVSYPSESVREALFAPMMRQQTPILEESKFHPNVKSAIIYTHFSTAYSPIPKSRAMNDDFGEGQGMRLTFWTDPHAGSPDDRMSLKIRIDLYESVRKIILLYRTALVSIPLSIVSIAIAFQIHQYLKSGLFPSLGVALSRVSDEYLFKTLCIIIGVQLLQSTVLYLKGMGQPGLVDSTNGSPHTSLVTTSTWISGLLLGDRHPEFAFLDCLIFLVGLGWTNLVYLVVYFICGLLAKLMVTVRGGRGFQSLRHRSSVRYTSGSGFRPTLSTETISLSVLVLLTTFISPYQFTYLIVVVTHLIRTLRTLAVAITAGLPENRSIKYNEAWNQAHYHFTTLFLMLWLIPGNCTVLVVWIKNLMNGWYKPFSTDRNILYVSGYLLWLYSTTTTRGEVWGMIPRSDKPSLFKVIIIMLIGTGSLSLLYGIRYTFRVFDLLNIVFMCLGMIHFNISSTKSQ